jgi:hypothetical protein
MRISIRAAMVIMISIICCIQAIADIHLSASVKNEPSLLNDVSTYSIYVSPEDKRASDDFIICQNQQDKKVYVEANAKDQNGFLDITSAELLIFSENQTEEFRLGNYTPMSLIHGSGPDAVFGSALLMLPEDMEAKAPSHYTIRVKLEDVNSTITGDSYFTYSYGDCLAYFNDSVAVEAGQSFLDAGFAFLWISANEAANGTISIVESESAPDDMFGLENPGFLIYFDVALSERLMDAIIGSEIRFYYTELGIDETSIRLYSWQNSSWVPESSQLNMMDDYISAVVDRSKTYAILGSNQSLGECEPRWRCTAWSDCKGGKQKRSCWDVNSCKEKKGMPDTTKDCYTLSHPRRDTSVPPLPEVLEAPEEPLSEEKTALFDIIIDLPEDTVTVRLTAKISLTNFGSPGRIIVNVTYSFLDSQNNIVYQGYEELPVETQLEYLRDFDVSMLIPGNYIIVADMTYPGQKAPARSEKIFKVVEKRDVGMYAIMAALIILFTAGIWYYRKRYSIHPFEDDRKKPEESKVDGTACSPACNPAKTSPVLK